MAVLAALWAVLAISTTASASVPPGGGVLGGNPLAPAAPLSSALAWGWNSSGQLGDGTTTSSDLPVTVSGLSEVNAMTGGGSFSLALLSNGTVMAWGLNANGQLGNGTTTSSDVPVQVSGLSGATAIAGGLGYSMALLSNGTVMAWGSNANGQLGNGTTTSSTVPVAVSGLSGVIAIASGISSETSLALLSNGTVMAWGDGFSGSLGNGTTSNSTVPVAVSGVSGVKAVAGGNSHELALLENGTAMAWGYNGSGQLGNGTTTNSDVPVAVSGLSGASAIAAGSAHSLALLSNGTAMAWGYNASGQLGNGNRVNSSVPVAVQGLGGAKALAGGGGHSLALLENGTVMAWGENLFGQLGNGTTTSSDVPVSVSGVSGTTAIGAGESHSMAVSAPLGPGPTVSSVQPSSGTTQGGTSMTITGTNLTAASAVKFGAANATSFTVNSATSITAVSPAGSGTVDVTVTTPEGTSATGSADQFTYVVPVPTVTKIEPNNGPIAGGTSVTITGTNLIGASAVKFGAANATSFTVNSATSITAVSPAGSGTVDVTVTTPEGTSATGSADQFTYGEVPTVTKVEPNHGPAAGGIYVTITGTKLTGATAVNFGSTSATSFLVNSETSITAQVPSNNTGKTVDVTVTTPGGTSATSSADQFTYAAPLPFVQAVSPRNGPAAGGTAVTITGERFTGATAVKFGSNNATSFKVESDTTITAVSPAYTGGSASVYVSVTTPAGTSEPQGSSILPPSYFRYEPVITSVSPKSGPPAGGTSVTIQGKAFESKRGPDEFSPFVKAVRFGSTNATSFEVHSFGEEASVTAVAPAGTGTVDVTVETYGGTSPTSPADLFSYVSPTVTNVEPRSGPAVGGTQVTISGTGLAGATSVKFGSAVAISFKSNLPATETITAFSPPGTGTVDVTVTTPNGTSATSEADRFTYGPPAAKQDRLYVTDRVSNHIALLDLGAEGQLLENGTYAFPNALQNPNPVVIGSDGNSLYAGTDENSFSGAVSQFTVASDGTLTLKTPPWVATEVHEPDALALSPDGTSLYAADSTPVGEQPGFVTQYTVGSGGLLTLKAPPTVAAGGRGGPVAGVAIAPNGASVYATNFGENTISQYSVGAGGVLSPMTPATLPSGAQPDGVAIAPDGGSLYVVDKLDRAVSQYSIGAGGALSPKTPATVPTGEAPEEVAISPDGKSVYVSDTAEKGEISQYTVEPGGALTPKSPASVPAERQPHGLAISPDGKNLYVAEEISDTVSQYRIEANGNLSLFATARVGEDPREIAFGSNGPMVTKVAPTIGPAAGGTSVTITGSHLSGTTAVKFGSTDAVSFTVNSETSITAVSPPGAGAVDVTVTNAAGTSLTSRADQFTYGPTVTKVEPNRGSPGGGTTVTITGTGFTGATAVKFGTTNAASFKVNSATSITAVSPKVKGAGTVDVTVTTSAGTSPTNAADQFTFSRK
jgi:alpha-tubulin suppressor-like RCC1 family protein/6-phosphogluconolactonase (cycloisomerase 2 family)